MLLTMNKQFFYPHKKDAVKILIIFAVAFATLIMSCSIKNMNKFPERKFLPVTAVIADSLFTSFPGTLRVNAKHLVLHCPRDRNENFLMVYDRASGQQIIRIGAIGQGPGEWSTPLLGNAIDNKLVVFDPNRKQYVVAEASDLYQAVSNSDLIKTINKELVAFVYIDDKRYIISNFEEKSPFEMITEKGIISCGKYPFNENINNSYDCFQGNMLMHPLKKIIIYATISNPYLAMYRIGNNQLDLLWENQFKKPDYSVVNQKLHWGSDHFGGISDVALTKDYIVCLIKDFKSEAQGRDPKAAPKAVYLFDYEGHLKHIFDLPNHTVRLAADAESNTFYAVSVEPDYAIVAYDLTSVGL